MESFKDVPTKESLESYLADRRTILERYQRLIRDFNDIPPNNFYTAEDQAQATKNFEEGASHARAEIADAEAKLTQLSSE